MIGLWFIGKYVRKSPKKFVTLIHLHAVYSNPVSLIKILHNKERTPIHVLTSVLNIRISSWQHYWHYHLCPYMVFPLAGPLKYHIWAYMLMCKPIILKF